MAKRGRFRLVEGKVVSVRASGGTIGVDFGQHRSEDFTVTILKRNARQFTATGLAFARGAPPARFEERGGPWSEAAEPESDRSHRNVAVIGEA